MKPTFFSEKPRGAGIDLLNGILFGNDVQKRKQEEIKMEYNYFEAVKEDVLQAIRDNYDLSEYESRDELEQTLNEELWVDDSVTGNGSGSYTFSRYKAEEYLMRNLDILAEAIEEFGGNMDVLKDGPEACDVAIRCYLLGQAIAEVLGEMEEGEEDVA